MDDTVLLFVIPASLLGLWISSGIFEWVVFQRIFDDPVKGKLTSLAVAFAASMVSLYSNADEYFWAATFSLTVALMVLAFFDYRRGMRLRSQIVSTQSVEDVFK